jgi:hypothetical protein
MREAIKTLTSSYEKTNLRLKSIMEIAERRASNLEA